MQSLQEYVFRNEALLSRIAVFSVVLDAVRNVQFVVHAAQIVNEEFYFLFRCLAAKFHLVSDHCITFCCSLVFCVERDNLRQVHSVCCAVDQVSAVISECCACFMCHGVNNTKKCIGECHTSEALCVVHAVTFCHISVVGIYQVCLNHLDCIQCQRIGEVTVRGGNVCLDCMGHSVHTGVSN